ncbi:MAG: Ig-like domain-containing protein, partial [Oscillospiraceae bacterium]|nr:Ig-like domain-containing protein [Oscillospiraceae bacterium]
TRTSTIKSAKGTYTAESEGEYYIAFSSTTAGYLRAVELALSLITKLDAVMVSLSESALLVGEYAVADFSAKDNLGRDYDTSASTVSYKSSKPSVATIDEKTGEVYAVTEGETQITVKVDDVTSAPVTLRVTNLPAASALPEAMDINFPQGFIHVGDTSPLKMLTADGNHPGSGIEYSFDIEDESIVTEENGIFTAHKMGKTTVKVSASLGDEDVEYAFDAVVVGKNLFTRGGVRHGEFENSVYFSDNSNESVSASDTLWTATRDKKRDTYDYEIYKGKSGVSGKITNILKAIIDEKEPSWKLFWIQQTNTVGSGKYSGLVELEYGKIYELVGNIALENVRTMPTVETLVYFYVDGVSSNNGLQRTVTDAYFSDKNENQPWSTFSSTPLYVNWEYNDFLAADVTFRTGQTDGLGYDVLLSELSYHEVTFESVDFKMEGTTDGAKTHDTFETTVAPVSNTGKVIAFGNEAEALDVTYSVYPENSRVAKVDEKGVITVVSDGECEVRAHVTINGVMQTGIIPIRVSGLEVMFESIGVTARDEALSVGDTTQIDVALYNTDMSEASDEGITWYYESSDPGVAAVDQNGKVTAKAPGKAKITVFAKTEKITASDSVTISVSDSSPLASASVVGANIVEKGYSVRLSATALHESGNAADISSCEVSFSLAENAPEGIISVAEDGTVTGLALGTSSVVAKVIKGNTVYSEPYQIEVTEVVPKDHFIDFTARNATAENIITTHATIEKDGYYLDREKTSQTVISNCLSGKKYCYNLAYAMFSRIESIKNSVESDTAIVFPVKYSGWYEPIFTGLPMLTSGHAHIYLDGKYLGDYDFSAPDKEYNGAKISKRMNPIYVEGGKNHTLTVRSFKEGRDGGTYQYIVSFELDWLVNEPEISALTMSAEDDELIIGETTNVVVTGDMGIGKAYRFGLNHGYIADEENYVVLHSDNEGVIEIVDGVPKAVGEGSATVSADVYYKGEKVSSPEPITLTALAPAFTEVVLSAEKQTFAPYSEGCKITVKAYNSKGEELVIPDGGIIFESSDSATASVDENGFITPLASSNETCEITATVTIDGLVRHGALTVTVREGKVASTYYTEERVANARENIATYKWAKSTKDTAVKNADKYLPYVDEIYDMIHSQGILRSNFVGVKADPDSRYCRYCGEDLMVKYDRFPWTMDPLNRPWKIQCPECKRTFPSNDFESFYENGLDEHGEFDRTYALEQNGILCGRGVRDEETGKYKVYDQFADNPYGYGDPNGNLFNETYPELYDPNKDSYGIDPRTKDPITHGWGDFELPHAGYIWGVDDSLGYETGRTCTPAGDREVHTYISV